MTKKIKIMDIGEITPGDYFQVVDRERKRYTLKFESLTPKFAVLKQMGRGTTRQVRLEHDLVGVWVQSNFRSVEKVFKEEGFVSC